MYQVLNVHISLKTFLLSFCLSFVNVLLIVEQLDIKLLYSFALIKFISTIDFSN